MLSLRLMARKPVPVTARSIIKRASAKYTMCRVVPIRGRRRKGSFESVVVGSQQTVACLPGEAGGLTGYLF